MNPIRLIKEGINFLRHIYENKYLVYELTKRDFQQKYAGNIMGLAWAILDPLAMMLIFWLVFGIGFRASGKTGVPFITYLITGISSYIFFQGTLMKATAVIKSYSFMLKKVNFRVSILPIVVILSELMLHVLVLICAIIIILANGVMPTLYWLQLLYYIFSVSSLLLGLSWILSAINVFVPDISNIIAIFLRFFFYLTPIFWYPAIMPAKYIKILQLNPMFYIVDGYRKSLLYGKPFWSDWQMGLYFWGITLLCFILGVVIFSRLRPHFADVV